MKTRGLCARSFALCAAQACAFGVWGVLGRTGAAGTASTPVPGSCEPLMSQVRVFFGAFRRRRSSKILHMLWSVSAVLGMLVRRHSRRQA